MLEEQSRVNTAEETVVEKRSCRRLKLDETGILQVGDETFEVKVVVFSPKGALLDLGTAGKLRKDDQFNLSVQLGHSTILCHFKGVVIECRDNMAGVEFVPIQPQPDDEL